MPKSAKKRKAKAADFSKAKLKLGKGKQAPTNAIDTSFKARSIALPTQSIAVEKNDYAPTTKRRLTFEDLIGHLKHYSASTRKEAILGLRELLEAHWELAESSLQTLISASVRVIGDEDAGVRKGLLAFFAWLFPRIQPENLIPHSPLLLLFTTSAQTHIFPEIRIDAIRFLNLFLDLMPQTVVTGWNEDNIGHGGRILEGYLGILNAGTKFGEVDGPMKATSTASVVLTPASKLVVLQSMSTFLQCALSPHHLSQASYSDSPTVPTWYLRSSFTTSEAYTAFDELLQPCISQSQSVGRVWQSEVDVEDDDDDFPPFCTMSNLTFANQWTLQEFSDALDLMGGLAGAEVVQDVDPSFVAHLARTLHSTLISTFLDCAPLVFSPAGNPPETEVQLIMATAQIVRTLYGAILQTSTPVPGRQEAAEDLRSILGYMTTYFPFQPSGSRDIKLEQMMQGLNVIFCELTSLLVLASQNTVHSRPNRSGKPKRAPGGSSLIRDVEDKLSVQTLRVGEYIVQLLLGEPVSSSQLGRPLTPTAYLALLPTVWSLLNNPIAGDHNVARNVLQATLDHASRTSSKSALKPLTIEFVSRLVLLETEPQYEGDFRFERSAVEDRKLKEWITHLPKTLWELASGNQRATETIFRFLIRILQRKSRLVDAGNVASLRSRLVPYFSIAHAVRGQIIGPYNKIPLASALRRLALDVVVTLSRLASVHKHDDDLLRAVDWAVTGTEEQTYWTRLKMVILKG